MPEQRNFISIALKGLAMGMADVIPGVSGGTIAFITGIYETLIESIGRFDAAALRLLFKEGPMALFKHVNGAFLVPLFIGIGISIVGLARFITSLLETHPVLVWSFFFGLILASAVYIGRQITWKKASVYLAFVIGCIIAYLISIASPSGADVGLGYVFISGAIAICAMILPGISGSFILLLMGSYRTVFGALGHITEDPATHAPVVLMFALGAGVGLLSFAKLLNYLFKHHRVIMLALLTGFMLGSLAKVWPWKQTISTRINSKGLEVPLEQANISPSTYAELVTQDGPALHWAIALALLGVFVVFLLSQVDTTKETAS